MSRMTYASNYHNIGDPVRKPTSRVVGPHTYIGTDSKIVHGLCTADWILSTAYDKSQRRSRSALKLNEGNITFNRILRKFIADEP